MLDQDSADGLLSATVYDADDNKIGRVGRVYLDDRSGQPAWVTVQTGLFGTKESFLPLGQARLDGDRLIVPIAKDAVKNAPHVDPDAGHLSADEERQLYAHYGLSHDDDAGDGLGDGFDDKGGALSRDSVDDRSDAGDEETRRDTSPPSMVAPIPVPVPMPDKSSSPVAPTPTPYATADESPRSPTGEQSPPGGGAGSSRGGQGQDPPPGLRLRRHMVTEEQQITVPVVREEYILEPDPDAAGGVVTGRDDVSPSQPPAPR